MERYLKNYSAFDVLSLVSCLLEGDYKYNILYSQSDKDHIVKTITIITKDKTND